MRLDVMIDLETMSTLPNAAILSIGAVVMDLEHLELCDTFYQNVELSSCVDAGLHVSVSTQDWWAKVENREARDQLTKNAVPIDMALENFTAWLCDDPNLDGFSNVEIRPWSNGASFDIVILESAFRAVQLPVPWMYYHHMCFRTMKNRYAVPAPKRVGTKHNALDDAISQANHLFAIERANMGWWKRLMHWHHYGSERMA